MMRFLLLSLVSIVISALDVSGRPDWLDRPWRADWRSTPLAEVVEQIRREIARPVESSTGIAARCAAGETVLQRDRARSTVRAVLEALELGQDLACSAEPQRLLLRTADEREEARRRLVDIDLRRAGVYVQVHDFPAPDIGLQSSRMSGDAVIGGLADGLPAAEDHFDAKAASGLVPAPGAGHGNVRLRLTPEEEQATRRRLVEHLALATRRSGGTLTCGWIPATTPVATGIVARTEAQRIAGGLVEAQRFTLVGLAGQRMLAQRIVEQGRVTDAEVVSSLHDPVSATLATGLVAGLRCLPGQRQSFLDWSFAWVEPTGATRRALRKPAAIHPGTPADAQGSGGSPPTTDAGDAHDIDLDACWAWRQAGETVLAVDQALVLAAQRDDRRAVLVLEVLP
jgi:hypothetical protein